MRTKCNLDESAVIRDYKQFGCARACAEKHGVSNQTIYRILIRNGIPRKKPKEDKERVFVSNCKSKYCPALIVMLRTVCELSNNEIAAIVKAKNISSVCNIISRRGLQKDKPVQSTDVDMNKLEAEYLAGASTYELGEKYGVNHATISKWMIRRGHTRGRNIGKCGKNKGHETEIQRAIKRYKEKTLEMTNSNIEFVEYFGHKTKGLYRCCVCGTEFYRHNRFKRKPQCPTCTNRSDNTKHFEPGGHRHRCKKYGVVYDSSVTKKKLIQRDNNTCQICGGVCDDSDFRWGHFGPLTPTIDHIVAIANGGNHTWDNVQLAHAICNIIKKDKTESEFTDEVITHAKEQAIAYKCA